MSTAGVVIAGGGLAAQRCCETLRSRGYEGRLRVVCDEPIAPYDRPPLSKGYLLGETPREALGFRDPGWYRDADVDLLLGERAGGLDPARRRLHVAGCKHLEYEHLLIATGAAPRRLPRAERFANVHYLRAAPDADALREALTGGSRLAVVGAGFIGQEVAASARRIGADVTLIEALQAPLAQILGDRVGRWFAGLHEEEGVRVLLGAGVERLQGRGAVSEVVLTNGRRVQCDVVVAGIGVQPALAWARGSGLPTEGVPTDAMGRTAFPDIYAAGDAARPFDPGLGTHARSEHWESAARQGAAAARAMLRMPAAAPGLPSFWSDQYGLRIQYLGNAENAEQVSIEGDPSRRDFTAMFRRGGRPVAALLVGRPRALAAARRRLANPSTQAPGPPRDAIREVSGAA